VIYIFFLGGELRHRVGIPQLESTERESVQDIQRWSWIAFTHGTMFFAPEISSEVPHWLCGRGHPPQELATLQTRLETLQKSSRKKLTPPQVSSEQQLVSTRSKLHRMADVAADPADNRKFDQ